LVFKELEVLSKLTSLQGFFDFRGPINLRAVKDALTWVFEYPLSSFDLNVIVNGIFEHTSDGIKHHLFELTHPELYSFILGINGTEELNTLFLA